MNCISMHFIAIAMANFSGCVQPLELNGALKWTTGIIQTAVTNALKMIYHPPSRRHESHIM